MLGIVDIPFEIVGHAQNSSRKPQKSLSGVCLPSGPVPYLLSPDSAINLFIVALDVRDYAAGEPGGSATGKRTDDEDCS
jgi:hypothetical protein